MGQGEEGGEEGGGTRVVLALGGVCWNAKAIQRKSDPIGM